MAKDKKQSGRKLTKASARAALSRSVDGTKSRRHPLGYWFTDEQAGPSSPVSFSSMIPSILALYGTSRRLGVERFRAVWDEIYSNVFPHIRKMDRDDEMLRIVSFRGGKVRIEVKDNLLLQEVSFSRVEVLRQFQGQLPEEQITAVNFVLRR